MFDFLVKNPRVFCLSDDNFALREAYARIAGKRFKGASLLTRSRRRVEQEYSAALSRPGASPDHS